MRQTMSKKERDAKKRRKTKSYGMWSRMGEAYDKGGVVNLLVSTFNELDGRRAFGSQTNADAAWESLKQCLRDRHVAPAKVSGLKRRFG